jgi:hypothetical protein
MKGWKEWGVLVIALLIVGAVSMAVSSLSIKVDLPPVASGARH